MVPPVWSASKNASRPGRTSRARGACRARGPVWELRFSPVAGEDPHSCRAFPARTPAQEGEDRSMRRTWGVAVWVLVAAGLGVTAVGAADTKPVDDRTFVKKAGEINLAEINLARIAVQRGASAEVKQFGQTLLTDHMKAHEELNKLA